ncbi:WecB/TagA/CpsF family glycosyltransferase [Rhodococcus pyridinivorans]|uniref:WecB/TagA/CpsF family glycosyltransferase n=1 Tax=Rhodococcus pyridinivorans TaxID=103816 RepID=UPI0036850BF9
MSDLDVDGIIETIRSRPYSKYVAYALHVGGLNSRRDARFVSAMQAGDLVYADGQAVVTLARIAGATRIERASTTDVGVRMIEAEFERRGRPPRIAIVGGPPKLAERAGEGLLKKFSNCEISYATHGYHTSYDSVVAELNDKDPDVLIVGMGMPREAIWVHETYTSLPKALIITCGGWLGFLAGDEARAPRWMQRYGLEWSYRLMQAPQRLFARYARGLITVIGLIPHQVRMR